MFGDFPLISILIKSGPSSLVNIFIMFLLSVGIVAVILMKFFGNRQKKSSFEKWQDMMGEKSTFQELMKLSKSMPDTPMGRITRSALKEMEVLSAYVSYDSLQSRSELVQESIERAVDLEKVRNDRALIYLAFCSATGPLLGLLGTVWGIMNAFYAVGQLGSANITVVAPGIAEALLTTLAGLLVAIPASVGYNLFAAFNRKAEAVMYNFASELVSLFKRGDLIALEKVAKE